MPDPHQRLEPSLPPEDAQVSPAAARAEPVTTIPVRRCSWARAKGEWWLIAGAIPLLMLLGAVLVQVLGHEEPCPLCVLQRYACLLVTVVLWTGALVRPLRRPAALAGSLVALAGAGIAVHHTVVVWNPIVSCGIDMLQPLVNGWPTAQVAPLLFQATGMCTNPAKLLGLPLPVWSLLGFLVTAGLTLGLWWHTRSRTPRASSSNACPRCG